MTVAPLTRADAPAAARTLAAAFAGYPLLRAVAPDNPPAVEAFCGMLVRYTAALGTAFASADGAAVACWLPPDHPTLTASGLLRAGVLALAWQLGPAGGVRLLRLDREFDRARRRHVPGPHWYLLLLGVAPHARRRGLARAAIGPGLAAADRAGLPCYLETQDAANVPAYERLGFALVGRRRVPGGLGSWEMSRGPRGV
ncbi:MAG: GNAT family N-acetyltransferase [Gemmataceae bacterium]